VVLLSGSVARCAVWRRVAGAGLVRRAPRRATAPLHLLLCWGGAVRLRATACGNGGAHGGCSRRPAQRTSDRRPLLSLLAVGA